MMERKRQSGSDLASFGSASWFRQFLFRNVRLENKFSVLGGDSNYAARLHVAAQTFFRERIFEVTLDRATHRTRAVIRVVTFLDHELVRGAVQNDLDLFRFQARFHFLDLKIDNLEQVRFLQRMEDSDFVETIEKLRLKDALGLLQNLFAHRIVVVP